LGETSTRQRVVRAGSPSSTGRSTGLQQAGAPCGKQREADGADTAPGGPGARTAASVDAVARALLSLLSWGCSSSCGSRRLAFRSARGPTGLDSLGHPRPGTAAPRGGGGRRGPARPVGRDGAARAPRHRATPPAPPRGAGRARAREGRTPLRLAPSLAAAAYRRGGLAGDDRGLGQDRHASLDGEAFGSQSVTFADRL
jgi:hypothetical protein